MLGVLIESRLLKARRLAMGLILLLAVVPAVSAHSLQAGMPRVERHESRHEIDQLEDAWRDAVLTRNAAAMQNLLADDYMAITVNGTLQTKDQAVASLRAGRTHFTTLDISERRVRFYGKTALVTSLAVVQGTNGEGELSGSFRYTRVYARDPKGEWKIVSFEASRIRQPGDRAR